MNPEKYPNLIIGAGEAGKYLGWALARLGQKTIVVERKMIGGSCPNIACLPSKNVIYSAKVNSLVRRAAEFGVHAENVSTDMPGVFRRKKEMVDALIKMNVGKFNE